jgi:hypothetical protein
MEAQPISDLETFIQGQWLNSSPINQLMKHAAGNDGTEGSELHSSAPREIMDTNDDEGTISKVNAIIQ